MQFLSLCAKLCCLENGAGRCLLVSKLSPSQSFHHELMEACKK